MNETPNNLNNPGLGLVRASEAEQLPAEVDTTVLKEQQLWQRVLDEQGYFVVYSSPVAIGAVVHVQRHGVLIGRVVVIGEASLQELMAQAMRYHPEEIGRFPVPDLPWIRFYRVIAE